LLRKFYFSGCPETSTLRLFPESPLIEYTYQKRVAEKVISEMEKGNTY